MLVWCCSPARVGRLPLEGLMPHLVWGCLRRRAGRVLGRSGRGPCLPSAPDASRGDPNFRVEALAPRASRGGGPPPGDQRPGRGSGHRAGQVDPRHRRPIRGQETTMVTLLCDNMMDLSPHAEDAPAHMDALLAHQGEEGWGTGNRFPTHAHSPPGGLSDRAGPGSRQHGAGVPTS